MQHNLQYSWLSHCHTVPCDSVWPYVLSCYCIVAVMEQHFNLMTTVDNGFVIPLLQHLASFVLLPGRTGTFTSLSSSPFLYSSVLTPHHQLHGHSWLLQYCTLKVYDETHVVLPNTELLCPGWSREFSCIMVALKDFKQLLCPTWCPCCVQQADLYEPSQ